MIEPARYVPQRVRELTTALVDEPWDDGNGAGSASKFEYLARMVSSLFHFEFHDREHEIVALWDHLADGSDVADRFSTELSGLLDGGNYEPLSMADLEDALERESLLRVRLEVDLDDYDELMIYRRGTRLDTVHVERWRGLRKPVERTLTVDERVVVHARIKDAAWFEAQGVDPSERNLTAGHASLKQFVDVPRADIEMLLPSVQVKFRTADRLVIGLPAVASGVLVLATKLLPTLGLMFLLFGAWVGLRDEQPEIDQAALVLLATGAITLGIFVARQWTKLKNRRIEYWKTLTENLYFRTAGNGGGVLHDLLAAAEEQEVSEVLLAYRFLLAEPAGLTPTDLDHRVEMWLGAQCDREIDFEVDDATDKLLRLGIASGDEILVASSLDEALRGLNDRWDALFVHQTSDGDAGEVAAEQPTQLVRLRRVIDQFRSRLGERNVEREGALGTAP